ncbi:hypothetical protein, partial [Heyndrickxia coagulans]|uniref:hypothetical protein n=1 Tax=Heyndrickxia coagulans TaxID=1398 RepID=UPI0019D54CA6
NSQFLFKFVIMFLQTSSFFSGINQRPLIVWLLTVSGDIAFWQGLLTKEWLSWLFFFSKKIILFRFTIFTTGMSSLIY